MKKAILLSAVFLPFTFAHAEVALDTMEKRVSYTVGQQIGQQLRMEKIPVDQEALFKGISDFIATNKPLLDYPAQQKAIAEFQENKGRLTKETNDRVLLQGQAYLKANATKQGVKVTPSGLQYRILAKGTGAKAGIEDRVKVHYEGRLVDGTVFDSSYGRERELNIVVNKTIPGWQEALPMMPMGSKWQLTIPSKLAYGESGAGDNIPPNAVLVFDIEVFEILPAVPDQDKITGGHKPSARH